MEAALVFDGGIGTTVAVNTSTFGGFVVLDLTDLEFAGALDASLSRP
jgi:hypothetical protein